LVGFPTLGNEKKEWLELAAVVASGGSLTHSINQASKQATICSKPTFYTLWSVSCSYLLSCFSYVSSWPTLIVYWVLYPTLRVKRNSGW